MRLFLSPAASSTFHLASFRSVEIADEHDRIGAHVLFDDDHGIRGSGRAGLGNMAAS